MEGEERRASETERNGEIEYDHSKDDALRTPLKAHANKMITRLRTYYHKYEYIVHYYRTVLDQAYQIIFSITSWSMRAEQEFVKKKGEGRRTNHSATSTTAWNRRHLSAGHRLNDVQLRQLVHACTQKGTGNKPSNFLILSNIFAKSSINLQ